MSAHHQLDNIDTLSKYADTRSQLGVFSLGPGGEDHCSAVVVVEHNPALEVDDEREILARV
ncbi:MAG: hypothetical protein R6X02_09275 [Enhygromyxa sp.]